MTQKNLRTMGKKGNAQATVITVFVVVGVLFLIGGGIYLGPKLVTQSAVGGSGDIVTEITQKSDEGDVAQVKVYVRDTAADDVNTKLNGVPIYCWDNDGTFIIDGTSSSSSAEISGSTTRGKDITCGAWDSTHQTKVLATVNVNEDIEHVVIDAFTVGTSGTFTFYDDTFTTANSGASNVTISGEGTDSFQKMRFKNSVTNRIIPLGGFYVNTVTGTNISHIDISGSATLTGMDHASTQIESSTLGTKVTSRKDNFDYVFEVDDSAFKSGKDPMAYDVLYLEENDYLETGSVVIESDVGCDAMSENAMTWYAFTKGFFRETKGSGVDFSHETDAASASVITADIGSATVYCDD